MTDDLEQVDADFHGDPAVAEACVILWLAMECFIAIKGDTPQFEIGRLVRQAQDHVATARGILVASLQEQS